MLRAAIIEVLGKLPPCCSDDSIDLHGDDDDDDDNDDDDEAVGTMPIPILKYSSSSSLLDTSRLSASAAISSCR